MKSKKAIQAVRSRHLEPFLSPSDTGGVRVWKVDAFRYRMEYDFDIRDLSDVVDKFACGETVQEHESFVKLACLKWPLIVWLSDMILTKKKRRKRMIKHTDENEYTIGAVTDDTAEVLRWDDNKITWCETVARSSSDDTTGDAIRKAIKQRKDNERRSASARNRH